MKNMRATNFNKEMLSSLNKVLDFVVNNQYSTFYRDKYNSCDITKIKSYVDFCKIPLLTKTEILAVEIPERTFVANNEINGYSFSSGTSSKNKPLIIPRTEASQKELDNEKNATYFFTEKTLSSFGCKQLLILVPPLSQLFSNHIKKKMEGTMAIPGDIHNLPLMARIAKETGIDAILTTPTILEFFHEELKKISCPTNQFKWISIGGEFSSVQRYAALKAIFPEAYFNVRYGMSEVRGRRFYRCQYQAQSPTPNEFHIIPNSALVEIIDKTGEPASHGVAGEVVLSDLYPRAFPMIRYKTNDVGSISERACPCGNNTLFTMGGRYNYDVFKYRGTTISTEMIAKALESVQDYVDNRFQMHITEQNINGKIKSLLNIHLKLKSNSSYKQNDQIFVSIIKEKISSHFYLSRNATLKNLEEQGIFLPLQITFVDSWPEKEFKSKNIISDLQ